MPRVKHFENKSYNTIFAFTSMGGNIDSHVNVGNGPYVFRLNGQTYHLMGSLLPTDGANPLFAGLYMYDGQDEVTCRIKSLKGEKELNENIVANLQNMFDRENDLVKIFRHIRDRFVNDDYISVNLRLVANRATDGRETNIPSNACEFTALIPAEDFENPRDIIVEYCCTRLYRISSIHPSFMALQYPLLFPFEEDGYKKNILHRGIDIASPDKRNTVSMREYFAIPGQELAITSDEALSLEELPKNAIILGGGYIAVEFASIWRGMGATVNLCFRKELPLRGFVDEMRAVVARNLEGRGVHLHPQTNLTELVRTDGGIKVLTDHGEELTADVVLFATGRAPNTKRLNLDAVGVELDRAGAIKVDEYSRTNIPCIWAIGDVTNRMNLTPVALTEGTLFAKTVFGAEPSKPDYSNIPYAVFCIPPLSVVGHSEEQAIEQAKGDISVFTSTFNPMKNSISGRQEKTIMKLVVDAATDKVLGASMCGPGAPEIMQGIAVALKCGATKAQFDSTVGIHPSSAEEFVTMRSVTRQIAASKPKTNL